MGVIVRAQVAPRAVRPSSMAPGDRDIHERIYDEIAERIETLESGALSPHEDGTAWSRDEVDNALSKLHTDRETLRGHWIAHGVVEWRGPGRPKPAANGNRALT